MFDCELKFVSTQKYIDEYVVNHHQHPCYEIVFYIKGEGKTIINGKTYQFKPNTFTICEPNHAHNEVGQSNVEVIYIGFNILNEAAKLKDGLYDNNEFNILDDLKRISKEMKNQKEYYGRMLNLITEEILIKIKRGANQELVEEENKIQFILNFIKLNCMKNIKVKLLSNTFGFNYDYFRRMFKEKTGVSLKDYILQEKIKYSIDLIKNSNFTMKEIAKMSGFASPSHFGIVFKELMNMTPKEYLNQYRSDNPHKEIAKYDPNTKSFYYKGK